jgi:hypothetical protein
MALILRRNKGSVLTHDEVDNNFVYVDTTAVKLTTNQTISDIKTFTSTIVGSISGNAGTVTNGVYNTGNQSIDGVKTFTSTIVGSVSGNAGAVTNGVYTVGDQTIAGIKTFTSTIVGSVSGNSGTVTNGVYIVGNQSIDGVKTFTSVINGSVSGNCGSVTNGVYTISDQTIAGIKTFSSTIVGSINGNSATVTNGVYTTGDQSIAGNKTFTLPITGSITGNSATVTNGVYLVGNQTIAGTKTFSAAIVSDITGNSATVTNGVYTTGNQTITGIKTFSTAIVSDITGNAGTVTNGVYTTGSYTDPTWLTISQTKVGLGNVNNTSDITKNVLSATKLTTSRTINSVGFDGSANINIETRLGTAVASAATTTIGTVGIGEVMHITGTTTITSFGISTTGVMRTIIFDAVTTVTYNATSLIIPGASNITTTAGDIMVLVCENGASGYWRVLNYLPSSGVVSVGTAQTISGAKTFSSDVIQTPSASITPAVNGQMIFEHTNNTTVTIKLKGSDGVVRSVALTLA